MKKLIFTTFLLFAKNVFACEIQGPDKIYLTDKTSTKSIKKAFEFKSCDETTINAFIQVILKVRGTIHHSQFSELTGNPKVTIANNTIRIYELANMVAQKLELANEQIVKDVTFLSGDDAAFLYNEQELSVASRNQLKAGENTLLLEVNSPFQQTKREWVKVTLMYKIMGLVAKKHLAAHSMNLAPTDFKQDYIETVNPEKFRSNINNLIFYSLNRSLKKGQALEHSMLSPVVLTRPGVPSKVEYQNQSILIEGVALPMSSGKIGDIISLKNTKTQKIISGKVIDFNKVVVEL